jgi:allophanate hydrolase subunit 2
VSADSNRVALRLRGQPLRRRGGELASEGLVSGAIQALPDGRLVLFLADHPTTGGYPVIAVVDPACLPACAQARPGSKVSLRVASSRD